MNSPIALAAPAVRADATSGIIAAIRGAFTCPVHFELVKTRAWSSPTFRGAKHELTFRVEAEQVFDQTEAFLEAVVSKAFSLPGHLLAAAEVITSERRPGFARISIEALTVED